MNKKNHIFYSACFSSYDVYYTYICWLVHSVVWFLANQVEWKSSISIQREIVGL